MRKIIIIGLCIILILIAGCQTQPKNHSTCSGFTWVYQTECCESCQKLGYEYLHNTWSSSGWGREEVDDCFCANETQSIQIY